MVVTTWPVATTIGEAFGQQRHAESLAPMLAVNAEECEVEVRLPRPRRRELVAQRLDGLGHLSTDGPTQKGRQVTCFFGGQLLFARRDPYGRGLRVLSDEQPAMAQCRRRVQPPHGCGLDRAPLDVGKGRPPQRAVYDGRLPLDAQLPAERLLAGELGLARGTVAASHQILRAERLIVTRTGSGSTVSLPPRLHDRLSPWASDRGEAGRNGAPLDLTVAEPTAPFDELLQAVREATDALPSTLLGDASGAGRRSALHTGVADLYNAQGLATDDGHLLLTSGADAALSLLCAAYLRPNSRVVVDSPPQSLISADSSRSAKTSKRWTAGSEAAGSRLTTSSDSELSGSPKNACLRRSFRFHV